MPVRGVVLGECTVPLPVETCQNNLCSYLYLAIDHWRPGAYAPAYLAALMTLSQTQCSWGKLDWDPEEWPKRFNWILWQQENTSPTEGFCSSNIAKIELQFNYLLTQSTVKKIISYILTWQDTRQLDLLDTSKCSWVSERCIHTESQAGTHNAVYANPVRF